MHTVPGAPADSRAGCLLVHCGWGAGCARQNCCWLEDDSGGHCESARGGVDADSRIRTGRGHVSAAHRVLVSACQYCCSAHERWSQGQYAAADVCKCFHAYTGVARGYLFSLFAALTDHCSSTAGSRCAGACSGWCFCFARVCFDCGIRVSEHDAVSVLRTYTDCRCDASMGPCATT